MLTGIFINVEDNLLIGKHHRLIPRSYACLIVDQTRRFAITGKVFFQENIRQKKLAAVLNAFALDFFVSCINEIGFMKISADT